MRPITALAGVTIKTPQLESMTDFYVNAFGLTLINRNAHEVTLKGKLAPGAEVTLRRSERKGLGGLTYALASREDVDLSAAALRAQSIAISTAPFEAQGSYGFTLTDPDGATLRFIATDVPAIAPEPGNDRPLLLSHVVLNSRDATRLIAFYRQVLGFTVSDAYEKGLLTFLRCNQAQHHCIGISPGTADGLNHFAMDCGAVDAVMRSIARMRALGREPIWGPGRHGPGGNIFCYFEDPDGFVPEFTCDVLQIEDAATWRAKEWERTPANGNVWGTGGPSDRAVALMSGAAVDTAP